MSKELTIVDPKEFGIEEAKGKSIEQAFSPKLIERDAFAQQYETIITQELNAETFKAARELRLKLVKVRTGIDAIHKAEKAFFLASGKYVDALKNKLNTPIEQMEEKLMEIEKHEERLEAERKANLFIERKAAFEPYGTDTSFLPLGEMTEEQFQGQLAKEKLAYETRIEAEKKAEAERIEAERLAEEKRQVELKAEQERIEAQRLENERLKKEAEENAKQIEKQNRLYNLGFKWSEENQSFSLRETVLTLEFIEKMSLPQFFEYEAELKEINSAYEKEQAEIQAKKDAEAKAEQERLAKSIAEEKAKSDKLAHELKAKEDAIKAEQEKERERIEAEAAEKEAAEKAKRLAPDKEKINALFLAIKGFDFPECESEEAKAIIKDVKTVFEVALTNIKASASKLK